MRAQAALIDSGWTAGAILAAAERALHRDPTVRLAQIIDEFGLSRTAVRRRFADRDALIVGLTEWATRQLWDAVWSAQPETAPPLVAWHQMTANILTVWANWPFAMRQAERTEKVARTHQQIRAACLGLMRRTQAVGLFRADLDLDWIGRVYFALIQESVRDGATELPAIQASATRIVDTLFNGFSVKAM